MSFLYSQSLVAFLSALKVQSTRNVSIYYSNKGSCKESDRYLRIDCSATKTPFNNITQCDARADGSTQGESKVKTI